MNKAQPKGTGKKSAPTTGYCNQCPTVYGLGEYPWKQLGDRCGDLSLKPESGWPHNGCRGIICAQKTSIYLQVEQARREAARQGAPYVAL